MKECFKKILLGTVAAVVLSTAPSASTKLSLNTTAEAAKVKISKKKLVLTVGQSAKLTVKGTKKKVTWKTSNKKIATISKKGVVTAKKAGKAIITAKVSKKKYKCTVTVNKAKETGTAVTACNHSWTTRYRDVYHEGETYSYILLKNEGDAVRWKVLDCGLVYTYRSTTKHGYIDYPLLGTTKPTYCSTADGVDDYIDAHKKVCERCIEAKKDKTSGRGITITVYDNMEFYWDENYSNAEYLADFYAHKLRYAPNGLEYRNESNQITTAVYNTACEHLYLRYKNGTTCTTQMPGKYVSEPYEVCTKCGKEKA